MNIMIDKLPGTKKEKKKKIEILATLMYDLLNPY